MFIGDSWVNICAWLQSPGRSAVFDEILQDSVALLYSAEATAEFNLSFGGLEHGEERATLMMWVFMRSQTEVKLTVCSLLTFHH